MGFPINGDLVPVSSGFSNLGVGVGPNGQNAYQLSGPNPVLRPFNQIHQVSGVFHDALYGQSGVLRYSRAASAFQVSVDGGLTFNDINAGGSVASIGQIGGANLTGNIDLATQSSGFLAITDNGGASPIFFAVNHLALSGLWNFPTQGFNGRIVNSLTDFNGTTAQGALSIVGTSGVIVDIVGSTITIGTNVDTGNVARCFANTYSSATSWTVTHNLNTTKVIVSVYDGASPANEIIPDAIELTNANNVTVRFNVAQAGSVVVMGCN